MFPPNSTKEFEVEKKHTGEKNIKMHLFLYAFIVHGSWIILLPLIKIPAE